MRPIKFRAWDKKTKQWFYFDLNDFTIRGNFSLLEWVEIPKVQFTGLLDKNGHEIYEGDIVKIRGYNNKNWMVMWNEIAASYWLRTSGGNTHDIGTPAGTLEIIGNIYENPNLIEK